MAHATVPAFCDAALPTDERAEVLEADERGGGYFVLALRAPRSASLACPGQFAMLRASDGAIPLTRRPMSFHDAQGEDGRVEFFMRAGGPATRLFHDAAPGSFLSVLAPLGKGFSFAFGESVRRVALVAGGTGVAPVHFAARVLTETTALPLHLFYGGRSREHVHMGEFAGLRVDSHPATEDGSLGEKGLVTKPFAAFLDRYAGECAVLACGPTPMMRAVDDLCRPRGIRAQFALEEYMACGVGVCLSCVVQNADGKFIRTCQEGPVLEGGSFRWAT